MLIGNVYNVEGRIWLHVTKGLLMADSQGRFNIQIPTLEDSIYKFVDNFYGAYKECIIKEINTKKLYVLNTGARFEYLLYKHALVLSVQQMTNLQFHALKQRKPDQKSKFWQWEIIKDTEVKDE